jgi:hypothetical protein
MCAIALLAAVSEGGGPPFGAAGSPESLEPMSRSGAARAALDALRNPTIGHPLDHRAPTPPIRRKVWTNVTSTCFGTAEWTGSGGSSAS